MSDTATKAMADEMREEYSRYTLADSIRNAKVACMLVIVLMPAGYFLDLCVYPQFVNSFFKLRCIASVLAALNLFVLRKDGLPSWQYRLLCMGWYIIPSFFISWMIAHAGGSTSPYYAGLNLVILAASSVIQATLTESLRAVAIIVAMYIGACLVHPDFAQWRILFNNSYFIFCTSAIVITGNYFYNKLRFREFTLRFELDKNKQMLEVSNQKLKQLDEVKSRFFANISHELRTPLTLLLAPLESLMNRLGRSVGEDVANLLGTMHSNGMRLLKLINDLLDLVRLESGVMAVKREPLAMAEFLKGLVSAARQMADDKRIKLEAICDPEIGSVMADRDKLEKIILNLQFNALKFTPAGGRVELRASLVRSPGFSPSEAASQSDTPTDQATSESVGQMIITVKDTGMGISQKNLPHVFDRFWQADDSSRRKYQGVGIGLALVKELTEVQEGTVSVESEEGKGTTFSVRLPYIKADAKAAEATVAGEAAAASVSQTAEEGQGEGAVQPTGTVSNQEWLTNLYRRAELFPAMTSVQESLRPADNLRSGKGPKVLVADDEPDMLRFLKSQLASQYQVIEAVDGQQAIEKASQFLPDIILLDMMMPEKDGLQACKELREKTHTQSIPIILLTARADEQTKLAALAAGASDFLPKPFSTTELHIRVKNLVESFNYQRKLSKQNQVLEGTIEQLKETETQLVQTEKLASLGRMSAGIIHEINNPLNFATTGLYTLKNKAKYMPEEQREQYSEILKDIEEGVLRVRTIVSDLRSFSHHENEQIDEVPLADVVTSSLRFLSHEYKDTVEIVQQITEGQIISANKNKLIQVVVNLLQNSIDALKQKTFEGEKPTIWIEGRFGNDRSMLIVRDNGNGIAPENMDKIFDPFFTTKDVGEGMGLGLSICYRIVEQFEGKISVRSEQGKFCEFTLDFPNKQAEEMELPQAVNQ